MTKCRSFQVVVFTIALSGATFGARHVSGFVPILPSATPSFIDSRPRISRAHRMLPPMTYASLSSVVSPTAIGSTKEGVEPSPPPLNININTGIIFLVAAIVLLNHAAVDSHILTLMRGCTPEEIARFPLEIWNDYTSILATAPVQTKAITSATVYTIGDVLAQRADGTEMNELDKPRVLRSLVAGGLGHGPLSHCWYNFSEGLFGSVAWGHEWWVFIPKIVLDQTTWGPIWNNTYILMLGLMKRQSLTSIWDDSKRTTVPLVLSGLKLWPLAHCITYGLVPVENRLLWVDFVEIFWVTILSKQASGNAVEEDKSVGDNDSDIQLDLAAEMR